MLRINFPFILLPLYSILNQYFKLDLKKKKKKENSSEFVRTLNHINKVSEIAEGRISPLPYPLVHCVPSRTTSKEVPELTHMQE